MKRLVLVFCLGCFIGCSSTQQTADDSYPQLLIRTPLPPVPITFTKSDLELDLALFIVENGTVENVRMRRGSGNAVWDSLAADAIKLWRFCPARLEDKAISAWYRLKLRVTFANPRYVYLAEIICSCKEKADSIHKVLVMGDDFGKLARLLSCASSKERNGELGVVDINLYPQEISREIQHLSADEFTAPIKYGDRFAIFKRIK